MKRGKHYDPQWRYIDKEAAKKHHDLLVQAHKAGQLKRHVDLCNELDIYLVTEESFKAMEQHMKSRLQKLKEVFGVKS